MEEQEYYAPFGMSSSDFNSLIRRRFLAHLIQQLVEQGRVSLPGSAIAPSKAAQPPEEDDHDIANTPDPPVTDINELVLLPSRSSSIYSRDIDGKSFSSARTIQRPSSEHTNCERLSPASIALPASSRSSIASMSNNSTKESSDAANPRRDEAPGDVTAAATRSQHVRDLFSLVKKRLQLPSIRPHSDPGSSNMTDGNLGTAHRAARQPSPVERRAVHVIQREEEPVIDMPAAVAALLQRHEQRNEPQELQPPVDELLELGRLRRQIRSLGFDADNEIMLASDLTALVTVPASRGSQVRPQNGDAVESIDKRDLFRDRLARMVYRQITLFELESKGGSVCALEFWYRDVVDLVGWRDTEESRMHRWRARTEFF